MGQFLAKEGAAMEVGWAVPEIADGLLRLKSPEAKRIGKTASEVARTRFSWKTVAESWLSQVQELTTRTSPSPY
jgi:glycosyltransferase involved in cell wall biosynthesis